MEPISTASFSEIMAAGTFWRRWLARQWDGRIPDIDAEIVAAVWEQVAAGVTDQDRLFAAARTALRRVDRRENRWREHRRRIGGGSSSDVYETVVERIAATETVARLVIPDGARDWVRVMVAGGSAPRPAMICGRRWASRVREQLNSENRDAA